MKRNKDIEQKGWDEFRATGLLLFINQMLHLFGWVIVVAVDNETRKIYEVYPARTNFRGFSTADVQKSYLKITEYMKNESENLLKTFDTFKRINKK